MEYKRKRLSSSKVKDPEVKKLKGDVKSVESFAPSVVEKKEESVFEVKMSKRENRIKDIKRSFTGPIVTCFRKQEEKDARKVSCPICNCFVLHKYINKHLDDGCSSTVQGKAVRLFN